MFGGADDDAYYAADDDADVAEDVAEDNAATAEDAAEDNAVDVAENDAAADAEAEAENELNKKNIKKLLDAFLTKKFSKIISSEENEYNKLIENNLLHFKIKLNSFILTHQEMQEYIEKIKNIHILINKFKNKREIKKILNSIYVRIKEQCNINMKCDALLRF